MIRGRNRYAIYPGLLPVALIESTVSSLNSFALEIDSIRVGSIILTALLSRPVSIVEMNFNASDLQVLVTRDF